MLSKQKKVALLKCDNHKSHSWELYFKDNWAGVNYGILSPYSISHGFILPKLGFTNVTVNNDLAMCTCTGMYDDDIRLLRQTFLKQLSLLNVTCTHLSGIKFLALVNVLTTCCTPKQEKIYSLNFIQIVMILDTWKFHKNFQYW